MNVRQRNQMAMFMAVQNVFGTYPNELNTIPAFGRFINELDELMVNINSVYQIQMGNTTGTTQMKQQSEADMIDATVQLAAAMYVYAQIEGKPDLIEKYKVSPSSLDKLSAEKLKAVCTNVHSEVIALGDVLGNYGKSPEDVAKLKEGINMFGGLIGAPRSAIVTRSQAKQELGNLIDEANDLLRHKVDKLMKLLETTHSKVYNTYKAARVIVDLRAGKQVIEEE